MGLSQVLNPKKVSPGQIWVSSIKLSFLASAANILFLSAVCCVCLGELFIGVSDWGVIGGWGGEEGSHLGPHLGFAWDPVGGTCGGF